MQDLVGFLTTARPVLAVFRLGCPTPCWCPRLRAVHNELLMASLSQLLLNALTPSPEPGRISLPPPLVGTACCRFPCNPLCVPFGEGPALSLPVTALGQVLGLSSLVRSPWWVTFPPLHPQCIQNTSPVSSLVGFKPCCALPSGLGG